ncbi:MAG: hypothetical protein PT118_21435 [Aphanizomenon gracile PMC644.10]|nr:hypothetical protein [Aphanizomenon gracile PMC644.10]
MTIFQTTFDIPNWILQGLQTGEYVRIGGVIRDSNTKQIVAMLREVSPNISGIGNLLTSASPVLGILNLSVSVINLGVSVIGFTLISNKVKKVEESCKDELNKLEEKIQSNINHLHRKFDISVYANFRSALDLANKSQTMVNPENRRNMSTLAINRFLDAQYIYSNYVEDSLQENIITLTDKYITLLALTYIASARCCLELGEINDAVISLQEGSKLIRNYVEQYIKILLISEPIGTKILEGNILHGDNFIILNKGDYSYEIESLVNLSKIAKICKWLDPQLNNILDDKSLLLEAEERNLVKIIQNKILPERLVDAAIPIAVASAIPIFGGFIANKIAEETGDKIVQDIRENSINSQILLIKMEKIEQIIETYHRFESYLLELQFIQKQGINFKDWLELVPNTEIQKATSENIPIILLEALNI